MIIFAIVAVALTLSGDAGEQPSIQWADDLDVARKLAADTGRPLLIVFT